MNYKPTKAKEIRELLDDVGRLTLQCGSSADALEITAYKLLTLQNQAVADKLWEVRKWIKENQSVMAHIEFTKRIDTPYIKIKQLLDYLDTEIKELEKRNSP